MSERAPVCSETSDRMVRGFRPLTLTYKTERRTVSMPGWYCPSCGEGIHTAEDTAISDQALADMKSSVDNLLSPGEVRRIRHKLNLTQREAGQIIGGGLNAFQKYESGEVSPSKGISNFLRLLEKHPDEVAHLRNERHNIYEYTIHFIEWDRKSLIIERNQVAKITDADVVEAFCVDATQPINNGVQTHINPNFVLQ